MRNLSENEIKTVKELSFTLSTIELKGRDENGIIPYRIEIRNCIFRPDAEFKDESDREGFSMCRQIKLLSARNIFPIVQETKYVTLCSERELFELVGKSMGNVYMMNTL